MSILKKLSILATLAILCSSCGGNQAASRETRPGDVQVFDLGEGVRLEMVYVTGGTFRMGSPSSESGRAEDEGPVHTVELASFWVGKTEVTQEQYEAIVGKNPSKFKGPKNPVDSVSWNDAMEFCRKLSKKTGKPFRLPAEAEWEYACRAGTSTPFHFGDTISTDQANYNGNYTYGRGKKGVFREKTTPVGSFPPNAFGLYDMHGNVWEWCLDWYGESYYDGSPTKNPEGPSAGDGRVLRGGGWTPVPALCRSAARTGASLQTGPFNTVGFRVALSG